MVADNAVDIGWRLDRLNISRFHWRVLALIAAGMFFDSFDLYLASGVLGALVQSGESTLAMNATFGFLVSCVIYILSSLSIACYVPELFPTEVRLRGSGIANTAGRAVNIAVPYAIAATFDEFGLYGVLALISAALLLQIVMLATMGIETKQRSLEELAGQAA